MVWTLMACGYPSYPFSECGGDKPTSCATPHPPPSSVVQDEIMQGPAERVDVLLAISDAPTMASAQERLLAAIPSLLDPLAGVDWRVGVIPTHTSAGLTTVAAEGELLAAAALGTGGPEVQDGLAAIAEVLAGGFARDDAELLTIVVTDGDDASALAPEDFAADYVGGFALIGDPAASARYTTVAEALGGATHDGTAPDWSAYGADLGLAAAGLTREFFLTRLPRVATLDVAVEGTNGALYSIEAEDWAYDTARNSVTFIDYVPEPASTVRVQYEPR